MDIYCTTFKIQILNDLDQRLFNFTDTKAFVCFS